MMEDLQVWRFDDGVVRSHVIAATEKDATDIFDRVMGPEYREELDDVTIEIYQIPGSTELPIDLDGCGDFLTKTANDWIEHHDGPSFL